MLDNSPLPVIICPACDHQLELFAQFRRRCRQSQHKFEEIIKSHYPMHYETTYNSTYMLETPASSTIHNSQEYDAQIDLHSMMEENTSTCYQSSFSPATTPTIHVTVPKVTPHENYYMPTEQSQVVEHMETPHYAETQMDQQPIYVQVPELTPQTENCYQAPLTHEQTPNADQQPAETSFTQSDDVLLKDEPPDDAPDNDSFTYSDYDEEYQSVPSDRINVENAIDKKIEEFIQNKGTKAPKICTFCNKLFRTNYRLRVHMETHSERTMFICETEGCSKLFKSKIGLEEHSGLHNSALYNFTCDVCQKQFVLQSYFTAHKRIHTRPKTTSFCCSLCPKKFNSKQNLIDHENAHYGMKFFKCEVCTKSFNTKTHLDFHIKSHGNDVSVNCPVCNKFLKCKKYLKTHLKTHDDKLKQHICKICNKRCIQLSDLEKHLKFHTKEKCFICET